MDSNHRPLPCQGSALTRLSYGPISTVSMTSEDLILSAPGFGYQFGAHRYQTAWSQWNRLRDVVRQVECVRSAWPCEPRWMRTNPEPVQLWHKALRVPAVW